MPTRISVHPQFDRKLERLERRYARTTYEVRGLIHQLTQDQRPGDRVPGVGYTVYKVRLPNRAARRGKSGGFRIIYYAQLSDRVILLTIYSKTDQNDISIAEIRDLVTEAEQEI